MAAICNGGGMWRYTSRCCVLMLQGRNHLQLSAELSRKRYFKNWQLSKRLSRKSCLGQAACPVLHMWLAQVQKGRTNEGLCSTCMCVCARARVKHLRVLGLVSLCFQGLRDNKVLKLVNSSFFARDSPVGVPNKTRRISRPKQCDKWRRQSQHTSKL